MKQIKKAIKKIMPSGELHTERGWNDDMIIIIDKTNERTVHTFFLKLWMDNALAMGIKTDILNLTALCADYMPVEIQKLWTTRSRSKNVYFSDDLVIIDKVIEGCIYTFKKIKKLKPDDLAVKTLVEYVSVLTMLPVEGIIYYRDFLLFLLLSYYHGYAVEDEISSMLLAVKKKVAVDPDIWRAYREEEYILCHSLYFYKILESFCRAGILRQPDGRLMYKAIQTMAEAVKLNLFMHYR